ncbi:galactose oxidase [Gigaspora margarita]|uniref:Galactose oxidase n=1 Tax=Gigaspora margarita TaxID=4874 RepID=A0A8H4AZK4_GIGMA|nr:galactose oxidase [Gigaspora margarita]
MTWSTLAISINTPPPYLLYTATLLSTGIIVYIDGCISRSGGGFDAANMTEVTSGGDNIKSRVGHSAVLTQNGDIIIYGGVILNDPTTLATPYIAKLDTNSWMRSTPNLSQINTPQLCYHSAALYRDYMIFAFGKNPSLSSISDLAFSNNLYILDIKNYIWIISILPSPPPPPPPSPPNHRGLFIGIDIGAADTIDDEMK